MNLFRGTAPFVISLEALDCATRASRNVAVIDVQQDDGLFNRFAYSYLFAIVFVEEGFRSSDRGWPLKYSCEGLNSLKRNNY